MIDVEPLIVSGLDRLVPLPSGERADWDEVLRRAQVVPPRTLTVRRLVLGLAACVAVLAVLVVTPVGGAVVRGLGDFSDWLAGSPGKPATTSDSQRFEAANGRSWAAFPTGTRLRELITADVAGKRYTLYGFRSGSSLCLRLKASTLGHTTAPACATVSTLAHVSAPIVIVTGNGVFQDSHGHSSAVFSFGIAADGVSRVQVDTIDGTRTAFVGGNAYLWIENEPSTGQRALSMSAVTEKGRRSTVAVAARSLLEIRFGPQPTAKGPSRVEVRIPHPTISWYARRELRGVSAEQAKLTAEQRRELHASGFTRLVKPDPLGDIVIGLTRDGNCLVVVGGASGCGGNFFAIGPLNLMLIATNSLNSSDRFADVTGAAADGVARIRVFLADGERQTAALRDNLFAARVPNLLPIRVVAYNRAGKVVGVQTIPSFGLRAPAAAQEHLRLVERLQGPNGTTATVRLGRTIARIRCWRIDFSTGPSRSNCHYVFPTGPWVEADLAQPAGRDVFVIGHTRAPVVRVQLLFHNGETISTRPIGGLFVLAIPRAQLRPERQLAFAIGYDAHGNRVQRQGVLFRAGR